MEDLIMMPVIRNNQSWLPDVFSDFFDNDWMVPAKATEPAINVLEDDKNYRIELAAPGMVKDDFKISIDEDNNLVIKMEKKNEANDPDKKDGKKKDVRFWRHEFSYTKFQQAISLPENIQKDKISAKMEHGVLTVNMPKVSEDKAKLQHVISIE
jgi:HSP20 family protein